MPERNDFKSAAPHPVVNEIVDSPEVEPPHDLGARRLDFAANARLKNEHFKRTAQVCHEGAWRRGPILGPPVCCGLDLPLCARLDADLKRQVQQKR
ncbi:MAG: hypothetical protein JWP41_2284 [Ramlibacter sp.]|nr:hypothetical protein [Ramlibacter sp.]